MLCLLFSFYLGKSMWVDHPTNPLPYNYEHGDDGMCVGYYNNTIYLLGSIGVEKAIVKYSIANDRFNYLGNDTLPVPVMGGAQFWTQIGHMLYMIMPEHYNRGWTPYNLGAYNLKTNVFDSNFSSINGGGFWYLQRYYIPCLASIDDELYSNGGSESGSSNRTYILNLTTFEWKTAPDMNLGRDQHACIIHPFNKVLYSIGGEDPHNNLTEEVERISIINIDSQTWSNLNPLIYPLLGPRAVVYSFYIMVIGGFSWDNCFGGCDVVHLIDVRHDSIKVSNITLAIGSYESASIIVGNTLFSFGGCGWGNDINNHNWQTYTLFTTTTTTLPTQHPSVSSNHISLPTSTPAQCIDFDVNYNSNDGLDNVVYLYSDHNIMFNNETYLNWDVIAYTETVNQFGFIGMEINCSDNITNSYDICVVLCDSIPCSFVSVIPANNLKQLRIICSASYSCNDALIIVNDTIVNNVTITCSSERSCDRMAININSKAITYVEIHCNKTVSCNNMKLILNHETIANIVCFTEYACNNLVIETDNSPNIQITLKMYVFSSNVVVAHEYIENINIVCGSSQDQRYVEYDLNALPSTNELIFAARNEFKSKYLPCNDIRIDCTRNESYFNTECVYTYGINTERINLSNMLSYKHSTYCLWMDINDLLLPFCDGSCEQIKKTYQYNITFYSEITFNVEMNQKHSELFKICSHYFSTINITQTSLNNIDIVFDFVLEIIQSFDSTGIVEKILKSPESMLYTTKHNMINCNNLKDIQPLNILTTFQIESLFDKEGDIYPYFDTDSFFVQKSQQLISELFGVPVIIIIIFEVETEKESFKYLWTMGFITFALILCTIFIFIYFHRKRESKLEAERTKKTIAIRNPMVLMIPIEFYNNELYHLTDLDGIDIDFRKIFYLFAKMFNYTMYPDFNPRSIKLEWKQNEVKEFLLSKAKELNDNLESGGKQYDGLLVVVSSHGTKNMIFCSDGKKIEKTVLHRWFSNKYPNIRTIPRIFIYDSCDGEKEKHKVLQSDSFDGIDIEQEMKENEREENVKHELKLQRIDTDTIYLQEIDEAKHGDLWEISQDNPDYQLCVIKASNIGYQSKMDSVKGSYLIVKLVERIKWNVLSNNNYLFLGEMFAEIQNELHELCQLPVMTANNNTQFIKFFVKKKDTQIVYNDKIKEADTEIIETMIEMEKQTSLMH